MGKEKSQEKQEKNDYQTIEALAEKLEVSKVILEGTKALKCWSNGKMVTEAMFTQAVNEFKQSSMRK